MTTDSTQKKIGKAMKQYFDVCKKSEEGNRNITG